MAGISGAHVVLTVKDTKEAIDWYTSALGMELMAHDQDLDLAFLSFGTRDHDIGLLKTLEAWRPEARDWRTPP